MPPPVRVVFVAEGTQAVTAAFASLQKRAQEFARYQSQQARAGAKAAQQAANDSAKGAERSAQGQARAGAAAERAATRTAAQRAKAADRAADQEGKAAERAANRTIKEAERAARARERVAAQSAQRLEQQQSRLARHEEQLAQRAARSVQSQGRSAANVVGRAGRSAFGLLSGAAAGMGIGSGLAIGDALHGAMENQRKATLISNLASVPGFAPVDPKMLQSEATRVAKTTGFESSSVLDAMMTVAEKAEGAKGLEKFRVDLDDIAKTAIAAGVSIEDMGSVAAAAYNSGTKSGQPLQQLMRDLVQMGKSGSINFSALAGELAQMAGAGQLLANSGPDMIRELVAMSQFAVKQKVDPAETRTAITHMINEVALKSDTLEHALGKGAVKDAKTHLIKSPVDILAGALEAAYDPKRGLKFGHETKHDVGAIMELFGQHGAATANMVTKIFTEAGGGAAGKDAVKKAFRDMQGSTMSEGQRDVEYSKMMGTDAQKFAVNMAVFRAKIGEMLPAFTALLPSILKATQEFANLAVAFTRNPIAGFGVLLGALLAKEIAAAGLSKILTVAITEALAARAGLGGLGGGVGLLGTAGAAAGIGLAAGALAYAGVKWMDASEEEGTEAGERAFRTEADASNMSGYLRTAVRQGRTLTPQQLKLAKGVAAHAQEAATDLGEAENPLNPLTRQAAEAGAAGLSPETAKATADALSNLIASIESAAGKIKGVDMSAPGNAARSGSPPTRTSLAH